MSAGRLPAAALLLSLLAACAVVPQIYHGQLAMLDKGLSADEVATRLRLPALSVHSASSAGRSFVFHRFYMNNGMQIDLYLLAYEKDRLVYWGYVSEFRRLQDAALVDALASVLPQMQPSR